MSGVDVSLKKKSTRSCIPIKPNRGFPFGAFFRVYLNDRPSSARGLQVRFLFSRIAISTDRACVLRITFVRLSCATRNKTVFCEADNCSAAGSAFFFFKQKTAYEIDM